MCKVQTVAIIDSGIGGVSVLNRFLKNSFKGNFIYLVDNLFMPYGNKNKKFLKDRIEYLIVFLKQHYKADQIYIACNTASSVFNEREIENVHFLSFNKNDTYIVTSLSKKNLKGYKTISCKRLAEKIEDNIFNKQKLGDIIKRITAQKGINKLNNYTLGCTHYELAYDEFKNACPNSVIKLNSSSVDYFEETNNQLNIVIVTTKKDFEYEKKIRKLIVY